MTLSKFFARVVPLSALCLAGHAFAAPTALNPGDTITAPDPETIPNSTLVTSSVVDFSTTTSSGNSFSGRLGVDVFSNNSQNPFGGLTFVYELKNLNSIASEGISSFSLSGWSGVQLAVTQGNALQFLPSDQPVLPADFSRSGGTGDVVTVDYPLNFNAPPIFGGQSSYQLVMYTNAASWTNLTTNVTVTNFDSTAQDAVNVGTIGPSAVPDRSSTFVLLTMGLACIGFALIRGRGANPGHRT